MLKINYGYIYKTTNTITGNIYIGKKVGNFDNTYLGSGVYLKRAIKKFGKYNFKTEIIVTASTKKELNDLEKYCIKKYRCELGRKELYNLADGGDGGNVWENGSPSEEQRKRISLKSKGHLTHKIKTCNCFICKSIRFGRKSKLNPMFGKRYRHSKETIEKIKLTKKMNPYKHSKETKEKIRKIMLGSKRGKYNV